MSDEPHTVAVDEAMKRLDVLLDYDCGNGPEPCVHTLADAGLALIGAHWPLVDVRALIAEHGVEEAGEQASAMQHGLVVLRPPPLKPLFLATRPELEDDPDKEDA